ncbi:TetR/AcrR family transcriptional regulator [Sphingomonas sp.]|uniref:TetR/AcrR family transcriptional regulator n=1 Tax=Sphingomonas sp. TaxID=28214 RepID=UPI0025E51EC0|nr:TetR/AcrR family transcriptional regulator [Sphingomonas sp.]
MVRAAAELMQRRGYHGAGVAEILARANAPRGSLYYYFPAGKRQIAVEAVQLAAAVFADDLGNAGAAATSLDDLFERWESLSTRDLLQSDYEAACPVAATALDVPQAEIDVVGACSATFARWEGAAVAGLARFLPEGVAKQAGIIVTDALLGATMVARVGRDAARVRETLAALRALLTSA